MRLSQTIAAKLTAGLLAMTAVVTPSLALSGTVVADDGLRVRAEASAQADVLSTLPNGTAVEVLQPECDGWYQISFQDTMGYVSADYLAVEREVTYGKVVVGPLNIRTGPGTDYGKAGQLSADAVVEILDQTDGWYQIDQGYVSSDYVAMIAADEAAALLSGSGLGQEISQYAQTLIGCRYVYGGTSPSGFDCSGFAQYVYKQFGVSINRTASAQMDNGASVSMSELQPGDLVFFKKSGTGSSRASHVGIYIGGGQFVHASSSKVGVIISNLDSAYYTTGFVGARRIV